MTGLLVHEWMGSSGGAEKVFESMASTFPEADIHYLWNEGPSRFSSRRVRESWLARTPLRRNKALALPFMVPTWRMLTGASNYDWMLVSSHLFAHHARIRDQSSMIPKYIYAHTPARYIWTPELDQRGAGLGIRTVAPAFRALDRRRAQEPTAIAANSQFVRERIARTWEREASVIHPPVAAAHIHRFKDWAQRVTDPREGAFLASLPRDFVLGASRFIPYKRLDLVLRAGEQVGLPVVLAGGGPEEQRLKSIAGDLTVPVYFAIAPSDALLYALYQRSGVFVFPAIEDFGIMPVEAQAAGTPVVTGRIGGQVETFIPGVSGIIADSTELTDLAAAIEAAIDLPPFDPVGVTDRFGAERFERELKAFVA